MSTLGSTSVGTSFGVTPAVAQLRGVAVGAVPSLEAATEVTPQSASQSSVLPGGAPGTSAAIDELSQEAALVDGAISTPARPLAEIIWRLRAAVDANRGSVRASRAQASTRTGTPVRVPSQGDIKAAARAYTDVQTIGSRRTPVRSVDIYHGKK